MIQEHYGKYVRDDGDALLRAYVEKPKLTAKEQKTGTFAGTFSREVLTIEIFGGPNGNRTRVPDVRGRCPNR